MVAAQLAGCPVRVHILHGMLHPSLAPTFATEMWCMTDKEASTANEFLPATCAAKCMISAESLRLRDAAGVLDKKERITISKPRILVLGTSTDPTYSIDMRIEDLCVVKSLIQSTQQSCEWRFRPHPGAIEPYREELGLAGVPVGDFSLRRLDEDLRWSHVIITPFSSVGVDAHNLGRIVFWNQAGRRNLFDIDALISDGIGTRMDFACFRTNLVRFFPNCQGIRERALHADL